MNRTKKRSYELFAGILALLLTAVGTGLFLMSFSTGYYTYGQMNSILITVCIAAAIVLEIATVALRKKLPDKLWPRFLTYGITSLLAYCALTLLGDRVEAIGTTIMTDYDSGHGGEEAIYYSIGALVLWLIAMVFNITGSFEKSEESRKGVLGKRIVAGLLALVLCLGVVGTTLSFTGVLRLNAPSGKTGTVANAAAATYTVSYNQGNENTDEEIMPDYQFLCSDFSGMVRADSRFYVDVTLKLDGKGGYDLLSDAYVIESGNRAKIGDDTGLGLVLTTKAEGAYVTNADGTVTISVPGHAAFEMQTDTYSSQMKSATNMNVNGNDADGVYDSASESAVLDFIPETTFTLDGNSIVSYRKADPKGLYTVSFNQGNENTDDMPGYQFLCSDFSGMVKADSRFYVDISLDLDGNGAYVLNADSYVVESGSRAVIGDDTGLGLVLTMKSEGTYLVNGDGTVTTAPATHAIFEMQTDTYSSQMKSAANMNVDGNDADGVYDSNDVPAVLDFIPETCWTLENGEIVSYKEADPQGTYTVSFNQGNENTDEMPGYQFLCSDFSGMVKADSRFYVDVSLDLDGNGAYILNADSYVVESGNRAVIGDDTGLGLVLTIKAEGTYTLGEDGTVTTSPATHAVFEMQTDTYSSQMKSAANMNVDGNDADGVYDSNDVPAVLDFVPETVFTLESKGKQIVTWESTATEEEDAIEEEDIAEEASSEQAPAKDTSSVTFPSVDESTTFTLNADGTYRFFFEAYGVEDLGTYTFDGTTLTVLNAAGAEMVAQGDPLQLHYLSSINEQLGGDYEIPVSALSFENTAPTEAAPSADSAVIPSTDGGTTATFHPDGTFVFDFEAYGIQEIGTWTFEGGKLTVTNPDGLEAVAEGDPLLLHYVSAASEMLSGDFEIPVSALSFDNTAPSEAAPSADSAVIPSTDGGTTATFQPDGTFVFDFAAYDIQEVGTWNFEDGKLTVTNPDGLEAVAEGDPLLLHYVSAASEMLSGDYEVPATALSFESQAIAADTAFEETSSDEPVVIPSTDGGTTATFQPDGTFVFD
ncbi:MAG: hypothetical protein IJ708_02330, partial [Clostridia bacterium]|nr:hypothetical protein [Clostridia bacterium]